MLHSKIHLDQAICFSPAPLNLYIHFLGGIRLLPPRVLSSTIFLPNIFETLEETDVLDTELYYLHVCEHSVFSASTLLCSIWRLLTK